MLNGQHLFFLTCLLLLILWIILFFFIVSRTGLGPALNWFSTYLSPRTQSVYLNGNYSSSALLTCGVPQGSVLGPLLFTLYTTPLGTLLNNYSLGYHLYADDTQIYISFDSLSCDSSVQLLSLMKYSPGWHPINSFLTHQRLNFCYLALHSNLRNLIGLSH